jgi:hypothetical protein
MPVRRPSDSVGLPSEVMTIVVPRSSVNSPPTNTLPERSLCAGIVEVLDTSQMRCWLERMHVLDLQAFRNFLHVESHRLSLFE